MCRRPLSSTCIAVLNPTPSRPPIRFSAGTRQSSKMTSQVCAPRWPIFTSGLPIDRPGVPLDEERRDAARALHGGIGARHHREQPGFRRIGDEALGAVQYVAVAVARRRSSRARRRPSRTPARSARRHRRARRCQTRQPALLLCVGAIDDDALRADAVVGADQRAERGRRAAQARTRRGPLPPS